MTVAKRDKPVSRAEVSFKNRRVIGELLKDGTTVWTFCFREKRRERRARIRLSDEALTAMVSIRERLMLPCNRVGRPDVGDLLQALNEI